MNLVDKRFAEELKKLAAYLYKESSQDILMILKASTKVPAYPHKNGSWTWKAFHDALPKQRDVFNVGILLKSLIVLDFDDEKEADKWVEKFESLKTCPLQKTSKGFHFIFRRSALCDQLGLFDKARCLANDDKILDVDLKTICQTGTAGVLSVAPSQGKHWIRAIYDHPVSKMPDQLATYLASLYGQRTFVQRKPPLNGPRMIKTAMNCSQKVVSQDVFPCLHQIGFQDIRIISLTENGAIFDVKRDRCPLCGHQHDRNHWWFMICDDHFGRRLLVQNYSNRCVLAKHIIDTDKTDFARISRYRHIKTMTYCSPHVKPLPVQQADIFLEHSLPGTGKTTQLNRALEMIADILGKEVRYLKIIQICCRKVMAINKIREATATTGLAYDLYSDLVKMGYNVIDSRQLMIEMESLWRLSGGEDPDVLVLDEFESIISLFSSSTMREVQLCQQQLTRLILKAKFVIGLDAYFTHRGLRALDGILNRSGRTALLRTNTFQPFSRQAFQIPGKKPAEIKENFVLTVMRLLESGKRVVVAGGLKTVCDSVHAAILERPDLAIRHKYYSKDSTRTELDDFLDPDTAWKDLQLLMFTGMLTVAVSYNLTTFDTCAVYLDASGGPVVRDIFQMIHRVRHYIDDSLYFAVNKVYVGPGRKTNEDDIRKDKNQMQRLVMNFWDGNTLTQPPEWLLDTHVGNLLEENESRTKLLTVFDFYLRKNGYIVKPFDESLLRQSTDTIDFAAAAIPTKDTLKYQNVLSILSLRKFHDTLREYYNGDASLPSLVALQKYVFDNLLTAPAANVDIKARVFDEVISNRTYARSFFNVYHERNHNSVDLLEIELARNFVQMMHNRPLQLRFVNEICSLLGLQNSCSTALISVNAFKTNADALESALDRLAQCGMATRNKDEIKLQRHVAIKNRISSMFSNAWNGRKLIGVGPRKNVPGSNKKLKDYETYQLNSPAQFTDMFAVVRVSEHSTNVNFDEVVNLFGELSL